MTSLPERIFAGVGCEFSGEMVVESKLNRVAMKRIFLILSMLLLVAHGCATYRETPRHALSQLREAILNHDPDRAFNYIDLDRVVEKMFEKRLNELRGGSDEEALGLAVGRKAFPFMLPIVKEFLRSQLKLAITSSDETGYFSAVRRASVWYLDIVVEGDTALVIPKGRKKPAFRMGKTGAGAWRIIEIMPEVSEGPAKTESGQSP